MKKLMCGLATSLGLFASSAMADQIINVDGENYFLSHLTANCQSISGDPAAQIACFAAISKLLDEQSDGEPEIKVSVVDKLDTLREVAQYQDDDSGLTIVGSECDVQIIYFTNYFHISRRNVSTIDLFSAEFNASALQYDQIVKMQGGQVPLSKASMAGSFNAVMRGGMALDSSRDDFDSRSPGTSIADYANEIVGQLQPTETSSFDFVLVHPQRSDASDDIWTAFEAYVSACQQ